MTKNEQHTEEHVDAYIKRVLFSEQGLIQAIADARKYCGDARTWEIIEEEFDRD